MNRDFQNGICGTDHSTCIYRVIKIKHISFSYHEIRLVKTAKCFFYCRLLYRDETRSCQKQSVYNRYYKSDDDEEISSIFSHTRLNGFGTTRFTITINEKLTSFIAYGRLQLSASKEKEN